MSEPTNRTPDVRTTLSYSQNATSAALPGSEEMPVSPLVLGLILEPGIIIVVFGNLLVLLSLRYHKKIIVTDILLFSLSLADFVDGIFPLQIVVFMNYFVQRPWSRFLCDMYIVVVNTLRFASAGTVSLIAAERTYLLVFPLKYHTKVTKTKARKVVALTWILSLLFGILPVIGVGHTGFRKGQCLYQLSDLGIQYAIIILTVAFSLLFLVLTCFVAIKLSGGKFIKRQSVMVAAKLATDASKLAFAMGMGNAKEGANTRYQRTNGKTKGIKEVRRLTAMMAVVIVLYYISWIPILINNVVTMIRQENSPKAVLLFTGMLSLLYALSNPFLYGKMSPRYLRGYKQVVGGLLGLCGWRPTSLTTTFASHSTIAFSVYVNTRKISESNSKTFKNQQKDGRTTDKVLAYNNDDCTGEQRRGQADGSYDNAAIRKSFSTSSKGIIRSFKDLNKDFDLDMSDADESHVYDTRL